MSVMTAGIKRFVINDEATVSGAYSYEPPSDDWQGVVKSILNEPVTLMIDLPVEGSTIDFALMLMRDYSHWYWSVVWRVPFVWRHNGNWL